MLGMMDKNKDRGLMAGQNLMQMVLQALGDQVVTTTGVAESGNARLDAARSLLAAIKSDNAELLLASLEKIFSEFEMDDELFEIED